jgi:integrase
MERDLPKGVLRRKGTNLLYIRYYVDGSNGKRIQKQEPTGSDDPKVAEKMLRERLVDTERGAVAPADVNQLKYEDIRDAYLRAKPDQENYPGLKHLNEFFKGMKFKRITPDILQDYVEKQREENELSDPTILRQFRCLKAMLYKAQEDGKMGMRDIPNFPDLKDSEAAGTYIEPAQFDQVLNALPENLKPFFEFMYGTGCRLGALRKITWGMISGKDRDVINLPGSIVKTGKSLMIVLDGERLAPIAKMLKKMFRGDDSKLVFDSTNFRPEWSKACAKAGIGTYDVKTRTRTGVRIHDCRCSAAINLLDAGVDEGTVLKIGGWKTRTMLDRYNVQNEKRIRSAMKIGGAHVAEKIRNAASV